MTCSLEFVRLRVSGFKSFCDATELDIGHGLTGIVGPNGCGKSNIVEALRWVMGESSARGLRGGEMEDVIFGGSAMRASSSAWARRLPRPARACSCTTESWRTSTRGLDVEGGGADMVGDRESGGGLAAAPC